MPPLTLHVSCSRSSQVLPLSIVLPHTRAWTSLEARRPVSSLLHWNVICSVLGQAAICLAFQLAMRAAVTGQCWFLPQARDAQRTGWRVDSLRCIFCKQLRAHGDSCVRLFVRAIPEGRPSSLPPLFPRNI